MRKKYLFILFIVFFKTTVYSQTEITKKFDINFNCKITDGDENGLKVSLFEVTNDERKLVNTTLNTQKFKESFDYQKAYVVRFEKEGYITKELKVSTWNISITRWGQDFAKPYLTIPLSKQTGKDSVVLSIGRIAYSNSAGDFDIKEK